MTAAGCRVTVATAHASGGVAVVELRGPGALAALERVAPSKRFEVGSPRLCVLTDDGEPIDEAIVVARASGGFDLCVHGSPAVVARLVGALRAHVEEDVTQGDGVFADWAHRARRRLASVSSEAGARILVDQIEGALDAALSDLCTCDLPARVASQLALVGRRATPFLVPPHVVIAGAVNAGKSTLFNALVGRERALADARPGTTRDAVREEARDGDLSIELVDTAGERSVTDADSSDAAIEVAGQALGRRFVRSADLVLWCRSAAHGAPLEPPPRTGPTITIWTCADLHPAPAGALSIACAVAPAAARRVVWDAIRTALEVTDTPWVAGRAVPFEPRLVAALEAAAASGDEAVRSAAHSGAFSASI